MGILPTHRADGTAPVGACGAAASVGVTSECSARAAGVWV